MSLIQCPECGKTISDKALSCPNCGYVPSSMLAEKSEVDEVKRYYEGTRGQIHYLITSKLWTFGQRTIPVASISHIDYASQPVEPNFRIIGLALISINVILVCSELWMGFVVIFILTVLFFYLIFRPKYYINIQTHGGEALRAIDNIDKSSKGEADKMYKAMVLCLSENKK